MSLHQKPAGLFVTLAVLLASWGCGGRVDSGLPPALSVVEDRVDFVLVVPTELPRGTSAEPIVYAPDRASSITYVFPAIEDEGLPPESRADVELIQTTDNILGVRPSRPSDAVINVDGHTVTVLRNERPGEVLGITFVTPLPDSNVSVTTSWPSLQGGDHSITDGMEEDAFKVLHSMLVQVPVTSDLSSS